MAHMHLISICLLILATKLSSHGSAGHLADHPSDCRKGSPCSKPFQCDHNTGHCQCPENVDCSKENEALQIYKITMIFASCCLALILLLFLICLIRRTYCTSLNSSITPRESSSSLPGGEHMINGFNDSPLGTGVPFNIRLPFEKPPTYDESQRRMMEEFGVPPPEYPGTPTRTRTRTCINNFQHHHHDQQQQQQQQQQLQPASNSARENTEVTMASSSSTQTLTSVQASTSSSSDTRDNKAVDSTTVKQSGVSNCAFEPD